MAIITEFAYRKLLIRPKFDFSPRFPYVPLNSVRRLNDLAPLYAMKPWCFGR